MKFVSLFFASILCLSIFRSHAQKPIPTGFVKATITLDNGDLLAGYIKDNIRKSSSVVYVNETGENKKTYEGRDINKLAIDSAQFMCVNGDFFKVITLGKMSFLQKASNSTGKVYYNGAEPIVSNGTDGEIGDYFVFSNKQLKLITVKNVDAFISADLMNCEMAVQKAKAINGDVTKLNEAIEAYNSCNEK
jgi:hypothetical protein